MGLRPQGGAATEGEVVSTQRRRDAEERIHREDGRPGRKKGELTPAFSGRAPRNTPDDGGKFRPKRTGVRRTRSAATRC